ncbi:MAG: DUF4428 domain-containing protein [Eubacteriales bacterium]|nr:DUF4428 domain-containing protein [Eubacteriales bacterium]
MGLFDKKYCDICNEKIGLLGNRKAEDGNICKDCNKKLSPWFDERKRTTVAQLAEQLAYRAENEERLKSFSPTRIIGTEGQRLFIDESSGLFCVARDYKRENADLIQLSQVIACNYEIKETEHERTRNERREIIYEYDFYINLNVRSPWFDEIRYRVNNTTVEHLNSLEYRRALHECQTIQSLFGGSQLGYGSPGPAFANPQQGFVNPGQGYGQFGGTMPGNVNSRPGTVNPQGMNMDAPIISATGLFSCPACGHEEMPEPNVSLRFCPACGTAIHS